MSDTCGICCCMPVFFDGIWEYNRSRWIVILTLTWLLHRTYIEYFLTSYVGWPTCAAAYRMYDASVSIPILDDPMVLPSRMIVQAVSVLLMLMSITKHNSKYWLIVSFPALTASVVYQTIVDEYYCLKLSTIDDAGMEAGHDPISITLTGIGADIPFAIVSTYWVLLWILFLVIDVLLAYNLYKHVLRDWIVAICCRQSPSSPSEQRAIRVRNVLQDYASISATTSSSVSSAMETPAIGVAKEQPLNASINGPSSHSDNSMKVIEKDIISRLNRDYSRYDGIGGWDFNPSFTGIAGVLNAADANDEVADVTVKDALSASSKNKHHVSMTDIHVGFQGRAGPSDSPLLQQKSATLDPKVLHSIRALTLTTSAAAEHSQTAEHSTAAQHSTTHQYPDLMEARKQALERSTAHTVTPVAAPQTSANTATNTTTTPSRPCCNVIWLYLWQMLCACGRNIASAVETVWFMFKTVPLRVSIGMSISCVLVTEVTVVVLVVCILVTPLLQSLLQQAINHYDSSEQFVLSNKIDWMQRGINISTPTHLMLARVVTTASSLHADHSSMILYANSSSNSTDFIDDLLHDLIKFPSLLQQSLIIAAIFAFVACILVFLVTCTVYFGLHLEYWAQEREKDEVVAAELQLAAQLHVPSIKPLLQDGKASSMVDNQTDAEVLRQAIGYVPAKLERLSGFGKLSVRLARAVEGQMYDKVHHTRIQRQGGTRNLHTEPPTVPAVLPNPMKAAVEDSNIRDGTAPISSSSEDAALHAVMQHAATTAAVDSGNAASDEAPASASQCRTCLSRSWTCMHRIIFGAPSAPVPGPGGLPLNRFTFSGAFSFIPFYIINVLLTYLQVFLLTFIASFLLSLPYIRQSMITLLSTVAVSTLFPLLLKYVFFGWLLADSTRIKHKRVMMLVDTFFAFTVGALFGSAQAILRMALVMLWSVMRATQLHAQLVPRTFIAVDPGFSTHGSLMKCRYASGPVPVTATC